MKKVIFITFLILLGQAVVLCAQPFDLGNQKFIPPNGKVLFIVGQDIDSIDRYIEVSQRIPGGLMIYTSIQRVQGLYGPSDDGGGKQHAQYLLEKYPHTAIQLGLYIVNALDGILRGEYNGNIDKLGEWIKAARRPVYLRIGYEFDGPHNHYNPSKYKKAYRYIADRLRRKGVNNVAYVWHSYAAGGSRGCIKWYPGDLYVDWVAISFFNSYAKSDQAYIVKFAKERGKPLMIAESTPAEIGVQKGEKAWKIWYQRYFEFIKKHDVKVICYVNCDWDAMRQFKHMGWGDARVQFNPIVKEKWFEEINKEQYLHASEKLFDQLQYIQD